MTRINTNVPSLVAQNRLQASNGDLQTALTRLSTGLRINSGADDPAGLIASEALRSEVTSLGRAITNTRRASQIISTADSALGQASNLLNDIRGLVVEAANSGALSDEEIAANQLQIDSSLEAINRIAQTTTFQGRKLLDGSLDFVSSAGSVGTLSDVNIDQANLGTTGRIDVAIDITTAAQQASVSVSDDAFNAADVDPSATSLVPTKTIDISVGGETVTITGNGDFSGVTITEDNTLAGTATAVDTAGAIEITFDGDSNPSSVSDVLTALNALEGIVATSDGPGSGTVVSGDAASSAATSDGADVGLEVTAAGIDDLTVNYTVGTDADVVADFDPDTNTLNVALGTTTSNNTLTNIKSKIDALTDITSAIVDDAGDPLTGFDDLTVSATDLPADATGTAIKAGLKDTLVFQLNGADGAETFNFGAGTSLAQIKAAVNLVSDSTGVVADDTGGLSFRSNAYGSDALVNIEIISEGASGEFETSLSATRQIGQDIQATINGVEASARGNTFSINTSTLDLNLTVDAGSSTDFTFSITGGGALFQLGPDVTTNQQARLGIGSVSTGQLGGVSGRLYELGSGQAKSLTNDVNGAAKIIDEVINKVTSLRGRLGAFQATSLESNLVSLNETLANLEEAESSIRDADFAQESANLTRAQILVQSGTNVLSLANQNPQNVLSLLG
ncbi:flagellin N-terminal helical domain-containing protein [Rhodopirellula sallentina]|uniref:Flagellin n=1 Tax=Rhodopirellula sallentina SM41 TaxID=1263870 RepID=M5UAA6_9BACT|nr:flagellin [Rhodopirellula sallentina]EMI54771.1 flagellin domain protein [Rhodopirellula sallentina SM41]